MTTETEHVEQPLPVRNNHASIQSLVRADIDGREAIGIATYGDSLRPANGRDALRDLYEEQLDGAMYARQLIEERAIALGRRIPDHVRIDDSDGGDPGRTSLVVGMGRTTLTPDLADAIGHRLLEWARAARQGGAK